MPASSSRSTIAASSRASRTTRSTSCSCARTTSSSSSATASPTSAITGVDLLAETGAELPRVRELGYGRCRLAAAVPTDAPYQAIDDLAGLRVATAHPEHRRRFFARPGDPRRHRSRSRAPSRSRPRLGLAEAIVDLVSTGSTLVDERPATDRRRPGAPRRCSSPTRRRRRERAAELDAIDTMLGAVIAARGRKYLMMNAPATHLAELEALLPGLESPRSSRSRTPG